MTTSRQERCALCLLHGRKADRWGEHVNSVGYKQMPRATLLDLSCFEPTRAFAVLQEQLHVI